MIISREEVFRTPWLSVIKKDIAAGDEKPESYYSIKCADYVSIVALTPSGKYPLIHQFRQAVELVTCEFPAGLVDPGEAPTQTCVRELKEETGLTAKSVSLVATSFPDSGRLSNRLHTFFVETDEPSEDFKEEEGLRVEYVTLAEIKTRIRNGSFQHLLHVGSLLLVEEFLKTRKTS